MDFVTSVKTCFSKYVDWNGRALRSEYWWFILFLAIGGIVTSVLDVMIFGTGIEVIGLFNPLFSLATLLPSIFATTRRLHDGGRSGWWQLLYLTIIGTFVVLYWLIIEGDKEANAYGEPPAAT